MSPMPSDFKQKSSTFELQCFHAFHSEPFSVYITLVIHWLAKEYGIIQSRCGSKYLVTWMELHTFSYYSHWRLYAHFAAFQQKQM